MISKMKNLKNPFCFSLQCLNVGQMCKRKFTVHLIIQKCLRSCVWFGIGTLLYNIFNSTNIIGELLKLVKIKFTEHFRITTELGRP